MRFTVLPVDGSPPSECSSRAFLIEDSWDDWFTFNTQYSLIYFDPNGIRRLIGLVKIGQFAMSETQRRPDLPAEFETLGPNFFSVGQDVSYYTTLNSIESGTGARILKALQDVAMDEELFKKALTEKVTGKSLLRSVPRATVEDQFRRLAKGGARLSRYDLKYETPSSDKAPGQTTTLSFRVRPESQPPTNVHVLIGRNGVGKTTLLNNMARAFVDETADPDEVGAIEVGSGTKRGSLVNLVSVTFSAFDPFEPISTPQDRSTGMQYTYIGLKPIRKSSDGSLPQKDPSALAREFSTSLKICIRGARAERWRRALEVLESDPIFYDAGIADLANATREEPDLGKRALSLFRRLSSGHKIVLLTITRLVECVEERSLVLLDEPEAHLHPPLLSAFVRALSDLLVDRNGVAIIATHSPVVLQEVPKDCVWKLRRSGHTLTAERLNIETFGENVGVLTREVFGLEVTRSGFHRLLDRAVEDGLSYEEIVERFDKQLGGEARGVLRGLIADRDSEDEL